VGVDKLAGRGLAGPSLALVGPVGQPIPYLVGGAVKIMNDPGQSCEAL
jgi:hypothetical protein